MGSYSALAFKVNYLNNTYVYGKSLEEGPLSRLHDSIYAKKWQDKEGLTTFDQSLKNVDILKDSFCGNCLDLFNRQSKKRKHKVQVMKSLEKHLDIRSLVQTRLDLRLFLKNYLRSDQLILLRHQQERFPKYNETSDSGLDDGVNNPWDSKSTDQVL